MIAGGEIQARARNPVRIQTLRPVARRAAHSVVVKPGRRSRRRRFGLALLLLGSVVFCAGAVLKVYGNEVLPPLVDGARAVLGPQPVAEIEADWYGLVEGWRQF